MGADFELTHGFADFLQQTPSLADRRPAGHGPAGEAARTWAWRCSARVVALAGIGLAWFLYLGREAPGAHGSTRLMDAVGLYRLSLRQVLLRRDLQRPGGLAACGLARVCLLVRPLRDRRAGEPRAGWCRWRWAPCCGRCRAAWCQFYALAMVLGLLVLIGALMMWLW